MNPSTEHAWLPRIDEGQNVNHTIVGCVDAVHLADIYLSIAVIAAATGGAVTDE